MKLLLLQTGYEPIVGMIIFIIIAIVIGGIYLVKQNFKNEERKKLLAKRKQLLISKYGVELGTKLNNYQFEVGMTEENIIDSNGNPTKIEVEVLKTKTKNIYIYGNKSSGNIFVFVNGLLESIKIR